MYGQIEKSAAVARCDSTAMPRTADMAVALKALEEEIALLGSVADDLINRIQPVMSDPHPQAASASDTGTNGRCALSAALAERRQSLHIIRERLADAYQRTEL